MRIISYNLNGIRSAISKGLFDWLAAEQPDVLSKKNLNVKMTQDYLYDY